MQRKRRLGILVPVFSLRRDDDLGIGDTRALKEMVDWAAGHHVGFLQLLPINETGSDNSPYNAISSVALDPMLLDLEAIPGIELKMVRAAALKYQTVTGVDLVDYASVNAAKWELLAQGYADYLQQGVDDPDFKIFQNEHQSWLESYSKYRWLTELSGTEEWNQWPVEYNNAKKAEVYLAGLDALECQHGLTFYAWVQWHAFSQWQQLRSYAEKKDVKLMGDIPIGISYASADVFFEPQWFDLELSGGSPPETVFKDDAFSCQWGQNWGVPLYRWDVLADDDYRWWRRRIEKLTDVFHIFRIDHILGFYRLFSFPWRPEKNASFLGLTKAEARQVTGGELPRFRPYDDSAEEHRAANLAGGDRYLRMIQQAAGEGEVVGEDLGCVPDYVRPHLAELGIAGFKVCHWEAIGDGLAVKGGDYPECAFATYATHDHDPIPALWDSLVDMLGGLEHEGAMRGLALLSDFAGLPKSQSMNSYAKYGPIVKWALLGSLLKSNADYSALMITDLIDSQKRINIPGTVGGENWRYRLPWKLEEMPDSIKAECRKLSAMIQITGRAGK